MNFEQFVKEFESLLRMALTSGVQRLDRPGIHPKDYTRSEWQRFISGCHRGYAKAQRYMVEMLERIESSEELSADARRRCSLLVRSIAETMALSILADEAYMIRRLPLFDEPQSLNFQTLRDALAVADRLNAESRLTFALLTDLTLSIQVADLLRVDFRKTERKFDLIELKAGKVNAALQDTLADYPLDASGLSKVDADPRIDTRHRQQAKRMLRQQIRLSQVTEILTTDAGVDIKYKRPIRLTSKAIVLKEYDEVLSDLLDASERDGLAAGAIDEALVLGVGCGTAETSELKARRAAGHKLGALDLFLREVSPEVVDEVEKALGDHPVVSMINLVESALGRVAVRPLTTWAISRDHITRLVRREISIVSAIHLVGFIRLARSVGVEMRFATRKETAQWLAGIGSSEIPRWNGRALLRRSGDQFTPVTGGLLSRFLYNLTEPKSFLTQMVELEREVASTMSVEDDSQES